MRTCARSLYLCARLSYMYGEVSTCLQVLYMYREISTCLQVSYMYRDISTWMQVLYMSEGDCFYGWDFLIGENCLNSKNCMCEESYISLANSTRVKMSLHEY